MSGPLTIGQVVSGAMERLEPQSTALLTHGGGGEGVTVARNRDAYSRLGLLPRVLVDVSEVSTRTTVLGVPLSLPVLIAPVGPIALYDPDGAAASAGAAADAGTSAIVGMLSTPTYAEAVAAAAAPQFFQVYVGGDRGWMRALLQRVESAGCLGICIGVDTPLAPRRDGMLELGMGLGWKMERQGVPPNLDGLGRERAFQARYTWDEVEWLLTETKLPVLVKGITDPRDAKQAADMGVAAVYVSNHGGRSLDHGLSTLEALPAVADAVAGDVEIIVDGGIMRGTDVCKALALGADAVGIGRLQCWALGHGGRPSLAAALALLREEIAIALALMGCTDLGGLTSDHVRWTVPVAANQIHATNAAPDQTFDAQDSMRSRRGGRS